MACVTLKRSLDFDPVHISGGRTPKRRRCMPLCMPPATPPSKLNEINPSPFGEVSTKLTTEQILANVREEVKRLHRRKQLNFNSASGNSPSQHDAQMCDSPGSPASCPRSPSPSSLMAGTSHTPSSYSSKDKPLFTMKQVSLICERMLKETEEKIREEYDKVLNNKLAEQYDAFVKFTHDQLQKRFEANAIPSYLS